ncbi:unnamed protein product [Zymoseptoria tritici ST99CH_1E4]|uniref:DUF7730 domain-containing protein n=1 Tax=Zymoseptoria tritici ST99CH_1E4 TaxID=1276532 RepID=A0A2H1GCP4_ZYMTR|nr:unnamed protein product [Zymoseptoria tritici ST99CH_1E4]
MTAMSRKRECEYDVGDESAVSAKHSRLDLTKLTPAMLEQPRLTLARNQRIIQEMQKDADQKRRNMVARPPSSEHDFNFMSLSAIGPFLEDLHATNAYLRSIIEAEVPDDGSISLNEGTGIKRASFLGLPQELRDRIYAMAMPWGNIHVQHHGGSYSGGSNSAPSYNPGAGFTRHLCRCEGTSTDDETETKKWIDDEADCWYSDYESRHSDCWYFSNRDGGAAVQRWPFAPLFVCKQTYDELCGEVYRKNAFSFRYPHDLHAFATKIPTKHVSLVRDLRLRVYMGSSRDGLFHQHPAKSVAVCRAFSGVRKLHATLELAFWKMPQARDALKTDWKINHWARGLLNFGSLPLEHVSILVHDSEEKHFHCETPSMIRKHLLDDDERRTWAAAIRDQLLAPWDRDTVLLSLHACRRQEEQYHRRLCYSRVGFCGESCPSAIPEERIP